jgi:hypothetical protein
MEKKMNGIQVGAVSFVDEGVEHVLENLQNLGEINTLFLTTFTYGRGLSGRQIPGQPFPDHGVQASDEGFFHGGNYSLPNKDFYKNTIFKGLRAPDHPEFDILGDVLPEARKRGMKVYASIEDSWRSDVKGMESVAEVDLYGKTRNSPCIFHPDVIEFWKALTEDISTSYDIDGILFFNEGGGPLFRALGASHGRIIQSDRVTCFCDYHKKMAQDFGINFDRAKKGFQLLDSFVQASLKEKRPSDGYFVAFQRLLLNYPEIIAYDSLFDHGKHQILKEVHHTLKKVDNNLSLGFHIEHINSFNPFFRATRSYAELGEMADFLKVVAYNNSGGERYVEYLNSIGSTLFRDVPKQKLLSFNNHLLGYGEEADFDQLPASGMSPDYVFRETKRALEGVEGKAFILPGIDIGIPTPSQEGRKGVPQGQSRKASPQDTFEATAAGYRAGAHGVVLSRKYSEMWLDNLKAAGRAIREYA